MWMKVDDGLHAHRKTRAITRSGRNGRDVAPMGLWVLAGSWSAQNATDGWVPEDELDRWDDNWRPLATRLVSAGYWWPHERDGEPGFGFNDWLDYNPESHSLSRSGHYGNHVRWHQNKGVVQPDCEHCPTEPDHPDSPPEPDPKSWGDIGGRSGGDGVATSPSIALPVPDPTRPDPIPDPLLFDESNDLDPFDEFWDAYGHKVDRKAAQQKWRLALRKPGVTADLLIASAASYVAWERANNDGGRYIMGPAKWLLNERWNDERDARVPQTNLQSHLSLVEQLAAEERGDTQPRQIGGTR